MRGKIVKLPNKKVNIFPYRKISTVKKMFNWENIFKLTSQRVPLTTQQKGDKKFEWTVPRKKSL